MAEVEEVSSVWDKVSDQDVLSAVSSRPLPRLAGGQPGLPGGSVETPGGAGQYGEQAVLSATTRPGQTRRENQPGPGPGLAQESIGSLHSAG